MTSYLATNYRYIVYLLIRAAVTKYRTKDSLRYAGISLSKERQRELRRMMRGSLYRIAEESYQEFLKSVEIYGTEPILQDLEQRKYLGGIYFYGAEILYEGINRKKRQLNGLYELSQQYDAEIQQLRKQLEDLTFY